MLDGKNVSNAYKLGMSCEKTHPTFLVKWKQHRFCCNLCLTCQPRPSVYPVLLQQPLTFNSLWCQGLFTGGRTSPGSPLLGLSATPGTQAHIPRRRQSGWTMLQGWSSCNLDDVIFLSSSLLFVFSCFTSQVPLIGSLCV